MFQGLKNTAICGITRLADNVSWLRGSVLSVGHFVGKLQATLFLSLFFLADFAINS